MFFRVSLLQNPADYRFLQEARMTTKKQPRSDRQGKVHVGIFLTATRHQELKAIAQEEGRTMDRMLHRMLARFVSEHREARRPFAVQRIVSFGHAVTQAMTRWLDTFRQ